MTNQPMPDAEARLMARIAEALQEEKADDVVIFDRDEAEVLREWARFMMAWKTLGRWGASLRQVILFFGGALAFLAALRLGLLDWLGISGAGK